MLNTNYCQAQQRGGTRGERGFGRYVPAEHGGSHTRDRTAGEPSVKEGCEEEEQPRETCVTDHSPVSGGTGEGRRNQGRSWTGQVRQTCSYLSLLPTAWRNNWVSILIGNKLIFLKSTLPCPQQLVISPSLSQPRIFLNTFLLCKGWVAERELGNQARETHHNQPSLPRNTSGLSNYVILHYLCMSQSCSIFFKSYWRNTGSV